MSQAARVADPDEQHGRMKIGAICNQKVVTVCAAATLAEAGRSLAEHQVEALVVIASAVQRPTAIGIVTDRDILRAAIDHPGDFTDLRVLDILSPTPLVLSQDEDAEAALRRMEAAKVHFAPVVGAGGTLRGAVSLRQLLSFGSGYYEYAAVTAPRPRK